MKVRLVYQFLAGFRHSVGGCPDHLLAAFWHDAVLVPRQYLNLERLDSRVVFVLIVMALAGFLAVPCSGQTTFLITMLAEAHDLFCRPSKGASEGR